MTTALHASRTDAITWPTPESFTTWDARTPHLRRLDTKRGRKMCSSLEEAIRRSGLTDGATIGFHHAFRDGDRVVLTVVEQLSRMGFRELTLASSSLSDVHSGLIPFIRQGVVRRIFTSGARGELGEAISHGLLDEPVQLHSHGGRCALIQSGELHLDVSFLGVPTADELGNANGVSGNARCGSLGYAMVDADNADCVVLLAEQIAPYPNSPASIRQDQVDLIVQVPTVGDPAKIGTGAIRVTTNPRELLIARHAADVMVNSGLFTDGFSFQTGSGASAIAVTAFLRDHMRRTHTAARWALGGVTGNLAELQNEGLIGRIADTQTFDTRAIEDLRGNPDHMEISAEQYANPFGKGACVDELDMVILSVLEVDLDFNVNVLTGSDGILRGAIGGHPDTAAGAQLAIVVAPLLRTRIPTVVERVITRVTPGANVGVLVTDVGVAVNPAYPDLLERLREARIPLASIEELCERASAIAGRPEPVEFRDDVVGIVRYRDGSEIDTVRRVIG
ncbi:citrate lyase subunit alpha [Brooklawnia cerclae]|uniref:Citrate lyase alpha chain n=1 Tax=Brooklawnia cerclae TaxID=349934 RepID=A0ABX0SFU5_9ACTN|nr:citrate lyase subunit alpha [Brooklawnia cerclae]NIH56866.1 citrate lyase subunit alpha/citrate CoA-transferase [Brooklawnia cerclae]